MSRRASWGLLTVFLGGLCLPVAAGGNRDSKGPVDSDVTDAEKLQSDVVKDRLAETLRSGQTQNVGTDFREAMGRSLPAGDQPHPHWNNFKGRVREALQGLKGGPKGGGPGGAGGSDPSAANQNKRVENNAQVAVNRALSGAESLKSSLRAMESTPDAGALGAGVRAMPAAARGGLLDPSRPTTEADLALASVSGFGGVFDELGLKMGTGVDGRAAVLRRDGQPASPGEIQALQERIASEPAALMRRPDFFRVLPREKFQDLKRGYRERPELRETAFKHVGATERERDFLWSQSCSKVSGDCNRHTTLNQYQKGKDVPPEDLNNIWSGIENPDETGPQAGPDAAEHAIGRLSQSVFGGGALGRGVASMMDGVAAYFGLGSGGGPEAGVAVAAVPPSPGFGVAVGANAPVSGMSGSAAASRRPRLPPSPPLARRVFMFRRLNFLIASAVAFSVVFMVWRRRKKLSRERSES